MSIVHIVAMVLAVAALPGALLRVLPVQHEAAQRLLPLLMVVTGIGCWYAPVGVVVGVAAVIPASWLAGVLGIQMVPTEPANWTPLTSRLMRAARKVKDAAGTVSKFRVVRVDSQPVEQPVTEFIKPGDTGVLDTAQVEPGDAGDDDADVLEPPAMQTQVTRFVPPLA